jgi:hypothetical protein
MTAENVVNLSANEFRLARHQGVSEIDSHKPTHEDLSLEQEAYDLLFPNSAPN